MTTILKALGGLQNQIWSRAGSSSQAAPDHNLFEAARKINDNVYEVCKPAGRPSVEIVFFHGLQLEDYSSNRAHLHISTWVSRSSPRELWLKWLQEKHPDARILVISYDASLKGKREDHDRGLMDMYITSENLIHSLTGSDDPVGDKGCPVVLVGHCFGGLVMKELCLAANRMVSLNPTEPVENFLRNVKGFFTYASPHNGSRLADRLIDSNTEFSRGPLLEDLTILNQDAGRRKEDFRMLRNNHEWVSFGVGETVPVNLDLGSLKFEGIIVEEASSRVDVDGFLTISEDHFNICRPDSKTSNSFKQLLEFISTIVEKHSRPIQSTNNGLLANPKMVGLEAGITYVLGELSDRTPRLGIVGFGGMGKTTLAKAIYEKISGDFDYACLLEEIKTKMTEEETADILRKKIEEKLERYGQPVSKPFRWSTLKGKKVLIILDDAEFESHVSVMTADDKFSVESRVIVTSRTKEFLRKQDFVIHDAKGLDLDDSKRLFCQHVFDEPRVPQIFKHYEARVMVFANKCGGHPLALKVAGSHLSKYKGNKLVWDETFAKLGQAKAWNGNLKDGLWSILRMIINLLAPAEQEMFMDAATCFHGKRLTEVKKAWKVCSWTDGTAELGWQNLLDRCLVNEYESPFRKPEIRMHELLRDLGRERAGNTRVANIQQLRLLSKEEKQKVKVLTLNFELAWSHSDEDELESRSVEAGEFSGLKDLEILWLARVDLPSVPITADLQALRDVSVDWCSSFDTAFCNGGQLQALKTLRIKGADDLKSLPESTSQLTHLEIQWCHGLKALPCIAQLTALQDLVIDDCDDLEALPCMRKLTALENLEIRWCPSLRKLPSLEKFKALRRMEISDCDSLEALPSSLGQLPALRHLSIRCQSLGELPSLGKLNKALRRLEIYECTSLKALPSTIWKLSALEHLTIFGCPLEEISESIDQLTALRHLRISLCENLKALPSTIWKLPALEHLEIHDLDALEELPESIDQVTALRHSEIWDCEMLKALPRKGVGQLQALRYLSLRRLSCQTLPDTLGELHKLETLIISQMKGLQKFPDVFGQLTALQELELSHCDDLVAPPNLSTQLDALQKLSIEFNGQCIIQAPDWAHHRGIKVTIRTYRP